MEIRGISFGYSKRMEFDRSGQIIVSAIESSRYFPDTLLLSDVCSHPHGECVATTGTPRHDVRELIDCAARLSAANKRVLFCGGDHAATLPLFLGYRIGSVGTPLCLVVLDAHLDIKYDQFGLHGTFLLDLLRHKAVDCGDVIVIGVRCIPPKFRAILREFKITYVTTEELTGDFAGCMQMVVNRIDGRPVYLSIDLDIVDPAFAPAVAVPVPAGIDAASALRLVRVLSSNLDVRACDLTEYLPLNDDHGRTLDLVTRLGLELVWQSALREQKERPNGRT